MKKQMKKACWLGVLACASVMAFAACSNEEDVASAIDQNKVIDEVTIKLNTSASGLTRALTSNPVGKENDLNKVLLFIRHADDEHGTNNVYKEYVLTTERSKTVKFPKNGSSVYAFANPTQELQSALEKLVNVQGSSDDEKARNFQDQIRGFAQRMSKSYIGGLDSNGSFIMSGTADINNAQGASPYMLPVTLNRELSKVTFKVNKKALDSDGDEEAKVQLKSIEAVFVKKSAPVIAPFKLDGVTPSGFELDFGYNEGGFVDDFGGPSNGSQTVDNVDNNQAYDQGGSVSEATTAYTYKYAYALNNDNTHYIFPDFYTLPNFTNNPHKGTVVILKAKVCGQELVDNGVSCVGNVTDEVVRYYKARVSSGIQDFLTDRNMHYIINSQIKGIGSGSIDEATDESKTQDNTLVVTVTAAPWTVVNSDQTIE